MLKDCTVIDVERLKSKQKLYFSKQKNQHYEKNINFDNIMLYSTNGIGSKYSLWKYNGR